MKVRSEAVQTGGFRRRARQYVEESDRVQRSRHARMRRRSRSFMNSPGQASISGSLFQMPITHFQWHAASWLFTVTTRLRALMILPLGSGLEAITACDVADVAGRADDDLNRLPG
jgi:hypothetical protein